jgi:pimeloyl-ACP methyl ester carboxylesterase
LTKTARVSDVDIAYEVIGEGIPLTLLHMLFDSREFWRQSGYVEAFFRAGRQIILIDASGHGESSKPRDKAAYGLRPRADEVVAVFDELKIEKSEVLGYSLGGWTALGLVCHHPDRLRSAAIGGALPYAQNLQPLRDVVAKGPGAWLEFLGSMAIGLPPDMQRRVQHNDQQALAASVEDDRPDISEHVVSTAVPLLFIVGDRDPRHDRCKEFAERTGSRFLSVPGAHHVQTLLERDRLVPEIISFFDEFGRIELA